MTKNNDVLMLEYGLISRLITPILDSELNFLNNWPFWKTTLSSTTENIKLTAPTTGHVRGQGQQLNLDKLVFVDLYAFNFLQLGVDH